MDFFKRTPEQEKEQAKKDARMEISDIEAMKILTRDEDRAFELRSSGMIIGLCRNDAIIELLNKEIEERKKCLEGEENLFE